jgi:hypothetical protein
MANIKISNLSSAWTSSLAEHTAIRMNVTDAASSGSSKLIDLLIDGNSKFSVRKDSVVSASSFVGSLAGTASFSTSGSYSNQSNQSVSSNTSVSSSHASQSLSSSYSVSSSYASHANSSNAATTASYSVAGLSSSYSSYSGQSNTSFSASSAGWSLTASHALNGGAGAALSSGSQYNVTASWAVSASYALNSSAGLVSGSSYNITASRAISASHAIIADTSVTSSFALSAQATLPSGSTFNITASRATSASYAVSSSHAVTASYAERYAPYWPSNVEISGSGLTPSVGNIVNYVVASGSFTLIANALGSTPFYYRWYINSSSLLQSGSSNSFSVTSSRKELHSGIFTCNVTNSYGTATSRNFQVQVLDPVALTSETPPSPTPTVDSMVYFLVSATGDAVRYKWKKRGTPSPANDVYVTDGSPSILNEGAESSTLTIQAISPESEGYYFCEISNSVSNTSSSNMLIYVTAPRVVTQPSDLDTYGLSTVVATGSAISYSWEYNGSPITNQSSSTLNLSNAVNDGYFTQTMMDNLYSLRCRVYNRVGYNLSDEIQVKPFKKSGTSVTSTETATRGQSDVVAINASAQIFAPVGTSYTVQRGALNVGSDTTALGESYPKLTLHNVQATDAGSYTVSASFNGKSVVSDAISLTVSDNVTFHNGIPSVRYVFGDESHTLVADYSIAFDIFGNTLLPSYDFLFSTAFRKSGSNTALDQIDREIQSLCPNGISPTPDTPDYAASTLTMTGTDTGGSAQTSASSTTIYYQYATSKTHPAGACPSQSISTPDPWPYTNTDTLSGSTPSSLTDITVGNYQISAIVSYGTLGITVHPSGSQTKATGSSVVLRTVGSCGGATIAYRWYKNGARIPGATTNIYTISSVSPSDSGSYYCKVGAKSTLSYRTMNSSASVLVVS